MKMKKFCAKCGKSFITEKNETYCSACRFENNFNKNEILKQREVMNFIRDKQIQREGQSVSAKEIM